MAVGIYRGPSGGGSGTATKAPAKKGTTEKKSTVARETPE